MKKIIQLPGMYQIDQIVCTKRDIRIWHGLKRFIPAKTPCTVVGYYCQPEPLLSSVGYHVRFSGEFGKYVIDHPEVDDVLPPVPQ